MKNAKRIIASLTAAAAMGSCSLSPLCAAGIIPELPALTAVAADDLVYGDFSYKIVDDTAVTITKYNGKATEVTVPAEIDKLPVTIIGSRTFESEKGITKVVLPSSIIDIEPYAFRSCSSLASINFPEGLETISFSAFDGTALTEITLPKSLKWCNAGLRIDTLKKVTFADGIEEIPQSCLESADNLEEVVIPESVKTISNYAFRYCKSLKDFTFHEGLETIGFGAFDGTALTEITLPKSLKWCNAGLRIDTLKKVTFADGIEEIPQSCLESADNLEEVVIPESVKTISNYAFRYCKSLKKFKFHEGLETIGVGAFDGTALTEITLPKSLKWCNAGLRIDTLKKVTFADGIEEIPQSCFESADNLEEVVIPESVKSISNYAFRYCKSLKEFKFHEGLETIGVGAFDGTALTEITLPKSLKWCNAGLRSGTLKKVTFADGIEEIPQSCLESVNNLEEVVIPESVKSINNYAFRYCRSLKKFKFHEGLETIGVGAFDGTALTEITLPKSLTWCNGGLRSGTLKKVTFTDGIEKIPQSCLESANNLEEVVIPESVKTIDDYAFRYCKSLKKIEFHEGLETIGNGAFDNSGLVEITLPKSLKTCIHPFRTQTLKKVTFADGIEAIPSHCLENSSGLEEVILPDSVTAIDNNAFGYTSSLRHIDLPSGLTTISANAFENSGLRDIVIPDSVTKAGYDAFRNCKNLRTAVVGSGLTRISNTMFDNCRRLEKVTLPSGLESIGDYAFRNCRSLSEVELDSTSFKIDVNSFRGCYSLKDERFIRLARPVSEIKVDKTQAAIGNKLDFTVSFDVLDGFTEGVEAYTLNLTVPKELTIDEASVNAAEGTLVEESPISEDLKKIKFTTDSGKLTFSAFAAEAGEFDIDVDLAFRFKGDNYFEAIDSVHVSVKELSLSAPSVTDTLKPEFGGTGPKGMPVEVYMNDKLIASPVCNEESGKFTLPVVLPDGTKEGDEFVVYAKYGDVETEKQTMVYSVKKAAITDVSISIGHNEAVDITNVFTTCYSPVMTLLPDHRMKFSLNIANSDLLGKVYVVSTKDGKVSSMEAEYDAENKVWTAEGNFGSSSYVPGYLNFVLVTKEQAESGEKPDLTDKFYTRDGYIRFIIDPSGKVYEAEPSNPVEGAEMTIYTIDENDKIVKWDPTDFDQQNPILTNENGEYAWDVPEGDWKVMCKAEGYGEEESDWFEIPPMKTDIDFSLVSHESAEVSSIEYNGSKIEVRFSKYMDPASVNTNSVTVTGLGEYTVEPALHISDETYTDTFVIGADYTEAIDVSVKVTDGCLTYSGASCAESKEATLRINDPVETTETVEEPTEDTTTTAVPVTQPVETKPVETKPVETKPVETKPVETQPVTEDVPVELPTIPYTEEPTDAPAESGNKTGDVNGDGMVDSNDASAVLEDYAKASTGGAASLDKKVADINGDGTVDSNDASIMLAYYAAVSTGKDIRIEDFITEG